MACPRCDSPRVWLRPQDLSCSCYDCGHVWWLAVEALLRPPPLAWVTTALASEADRLEPETPCSINCPRCGSTKLLSLQQGWGYQCLGCQHSWWLVMEALLCTPPPSWVMAALVAPANELAQESS